jgi:hypothetical protein
VPQAPNHFATWRQQGSGRNKMFDWLIPLLIVMIPLIRILDYLDLLDIVATGVSLLVDAVARR